MTWRSFDTPPPPALAMIEVSSIARGMHCTDAMLKAADVQLVLARTICSGKYMVLIAGEQAEVEAAKEAAEVRVKSHPGVTPAFLELPAL